MAVSLCKGRCSFISFASCEAASVCPLHQTSYPFIGTIFTTHVERCTRSILVVNTGQRVSGSEWNPRRPSPCPVQRPPIVFASVQFERRPYAFHFSCLSFFLSLSVCSFPHYWSDQEGKEKKEDIHPVRRAHGWTWTRYSKMVWSSRNIKLLLSSSRKARLTEWSINTFFSFFCMSEQFLRWFLAPWPV